MDLIDRQAAIDAIVSKLDSIDHVPQWVFDELTNVMEELPSAEPEIIRCKDCKWFIKKYGWNCIEYTVCGISPLHHPIRKEEDFCSEAERRTDERSNQQTGGD